jgi:hypothetical protein
VASPEQESGDAEASPASSPAVTPVDLFAFGSRKGPRPLRFGREGKIDLEPDAEGMVGPEEPPLPAGASTFADPHQTTLTGHYHRLPKGTVLPAGLGVIADGPEDHPESVNQPTHYTIYPTRRMSKEEFNDFFLGLPWVYTDNKKT